MLNLSEKVVLVTGGSGLVGRYLKQIMPDAYYISSDDYDLTKENEVELLFKKNRFKTVIHLAARVGGIHHNIIEPVTELPGVFRYSIDTLLDQVTRASDLGIACIAIFPCTPNNLKTAECCEAWNPDNLVNKATRLIKKKTPHIGDMLDVALAPVS